MLQVAVIDGLAFAGNAAVIEGRLGMECLPRLAESGSSSSGLRFVLAGEINERGRPGLRLSVEGKLCIVCQRCLGSLDFPLQLQAQLELAASDAEIAAADDDIEDRKSTRLNSSHTVI